VTRPGLSGVSLPDLEQLLRLVTAGRVGIPFGQASLQAAGLGHVWEHVRWLGALDAAGVEAVLGAVLCERGSRRDPRLELVWTGPEPRVSAARDTAVVVRELFGGARRSVLVGGYVFYDGEGIFQPLHEAMRDRGVEASLFLHVEDDPAGGSPDAVARAAVARFFERNWPFGPPHPRVYYDPRTVAPNSSVSLHAKCVVVDDLRALVGSANFTAAGQTRNIEAGVLVDDAAFSVALARQWRGLVDEGLVVEHRG